MRKMQNLIIYIIFFHPIFNVNCEFVPVGRSMHTATLVGTKIYFLGGTTSRANIDKEMKRLNDFFYLDISKSFDKSKEELPFVDLTDKALEILPHYGAATSVFGGLKKDTIFFFGGDMGKFNNQSRLTYSFNTTQLEWKAVTVSQGTVPLRKRIMGAVTDNNDKIYIFGGGIPGNPKQYYSNGMDIFDTNSKIWTNGVDGSVPRDGHTATFLSETEEIIYIGGISRNFGLIDMTSLDVYNTINDRWDKWATNNPPEPRYGHTAVLTNDMRIIIFGGARSNIEVPVSNCYVVLNINTLEWYHGKEDPSTRAPFRQHTATLYNDYMFIAFGYAVSADNPNNDDVFIYKIGDYANFTEVNNFISKNDIDIPSNKNKVVVIGAALGSVLGIVILGFIGFVTFKLYKKPHRTNTSKLPHALDYF